MDKQILLLQQFIDTSHHTIVITGAGISMPVGIMDMEHMNVLHVMQTSLEGMVRARPEHSYKLLQKTFLKAMFITGPSITHKKIADLEKHDRVHGVITTNIDCLHTFAGSKNVAEIQGSYGINKCLKCEQHHDDVHIWNQGKAPRCQKCKGVVVSFPVYSHIGVSNEDYQKAGRWMSQAELVMIVGAKGSYSGYFNHINPQAKVVQINPNQTQFDRMAELNIREEADDVFSLLK
ncbi:MAG: NAD-dependent protein deacetylase [Anaerolineae bacterium]|nr:NAD-dependent protein deacetylase [Anaerolineae bacterium]